MGFMGAPELSIMVGLPVALINPPSPPAPTITMMPNPWGVRPGSMQMLSLSLFRSVIAKLVVP